MVNNVWVTGVACYRPNKLGTKNMLAVINLN